MTATSANLILTGELTGDFLVLDAQSGQVLYRFNTGGPITGGVMTYAPRAAATVIIFSLP